MQCYVMSYNLPDNSLDDKSNNNENMLGICKNISITLDDYFHKYNDYTTNQNVTFNNLFCH